MVERFVRIDEAAGSVPAFSTSNLFHESSCSQTLFYPRDYMLWRNYSYQANFSNARFSFCGKMIPLMRSVPLLHRFNFINYLSYKSHHIKPD